MVDSIRFYATGMLLTASLMGVALAQPAWLEALGVEMAPGASESRSYAVLESPRMCEVATERCKAKRQVIARLLEGELSLVEAAARFRDLNSEPEEYPDLGCLLLAGDSVEEKLCRQVILWALNVKSEKAPASEVQLLATRLEAELAAELCHCGGITFPETR